VTHYHNTSFGNIKSVSNLGTSRKFEAKHAHWGKTQLYIAELYIPQTVEISMLETGLVFPKEVL
jgi:hypothetical protein